MIIPAFNEERYLGVTLDHLRGAERSLKAHGGSAVQIVVVDNSSADQTAMLAVEHGATVVHESEHNIARVRNAGARVAHHDILVFLDADTLVPHELLLRIAQAMADSNCLGGAVDAAYHPRRRLVRAYLRLWRAVGIIGGMAQGACQFYRRAAFAELGGYDERLYMGEDVDLYWRLCVAANRRGLRTRFIRDLHVMPSARRFNNWPLWRTLVLTNPLLVFALRRRRFPWSGWYNHVTR